MSGVSRTSKFFLFSALAVVVASTACSFPSSIERSLRYDCTFDRRLLDREVSLRWLGTAGYEIKYKPEGDGPEEVILIDPFLTRPSLFAFGASFLFGFPLRTDCGAIEQLARRHDLAFDRPVVC